MNKHLTMTELDAFALRFNTYGDVRHFLQTKLGALRRGEPWDSECQAVVEFADAICSRALDEVRKAKLKLGDHS